ncbi:type VI secretion system Vgr family protein [Pseudomonas sp. DSP3-2-2]|uniref:type VI secretion system Vgr family protein n=1 Tax=unclassified Pseudomonas TaxID=196821 RepID=UPI003CF9F3D5
MSTTDEGLCSFNSTAKPGAKWLVVDWVGEEALSKPYRFEVRLACEASLDNYENLLTQRATLTLRDSADAPTSHYHGVVTEIEQLDRDNNYYYYHVVLEPTLVMLKQFHFSDIWLDHKLDALIADVLKDLALKQASSRELIAAGDDFLINLTDGVTIQEKPFICQFEESSFDFLSRRLEQAGVYYYFEQKEDRELLVFCNDKARQSTAEAVPVSYCTTPSTLNASTTSVLQRFKKRVISPVKRVALQDFSANIVTGMATLSGDSAQNSTKKSTYINYGEHYKTTVEGDALALLRAEALNGRAIEFHGKGRMTRLRAGGYIKLVITDASGHQVDSTAPANDKAATYYLLEVKHTGSQPLPKGDDGKKGSGDIDTTFIALPLGIQYRPLCSTPRPYMGAPLSAFVDAENETGQTINDAKISDEYKKYKTETAAIGDELNKLHDAETEFSLRNHEVIAATAAMEKANAKMNIIGVNKDRASSSENQITPRQAQTNAIAANTAAIDQLNKAKETLSTAQKAFTTANEAMMKKDSGTAAMALDLKAVSTPYLDNNGRYKLRFPFVRHDKSATRCSAFVRMATLSSGLEHGMNFPLLPGAEVLVAFLGGDPDRPIIIGSVPNEVNLNKVVDANKTQSGFSTPGGHFFAVDDNAPIDPTQTANVTTTSNSTGTPETRLLKIGTPAGQSSLTLGNGEINGAYLRTADHLQISSSSLKHFVPNIYGFSVGADTQLSLATTPFFERSAAQYNQLLTSADNQGDVSRPDFVESRGKVAEENLTAKWGGIPWAVPEPVNSNGVMTDGYERKTVKKTLNANLSLLSAVALLGSVVGAALFSPVVAALDLFGRSKPLAPPSVKETFSIQVNNASVQTAANYGSRKEELNDFASTLAYNYRGEKAEVNIGTGTYTYDTYRKEESTAHVIKTTSHSITAVVQSVDASRVGITTECYSLNGLLVTEIKGHNHKIIMSDKGVMIESVGAPILLKGDVAVNGSLLVKNDLLVEGRADIQQALSSGKFHTGDIKCSDIRSKTGSLAVPDVPDVKGIYDEGVENIKSSKNTTFVDTRSFSGKAMHWAVWSANKAMQGEGIVLNTKAGSLGSTAKPPEVMATVVYRAQATVQSLSHKVAMARALIAFADSLFSTSPKGKVTDDVVNWMD